MTTTNPKLFQIAALIESNRLDQARSICQRLLQSSPRDIDAVNAMALICFKRGEVQPALFYARRALELAPDNPQVLVNLARLLGVEARFEESLPLLDRASELAPAWSEPHLLAGVALITLKRACDAVARCERGLAAAPADKGLRVNLAGALLEAARADEACNLYWKLAAEFPDDDLIASNLANATNYAPSVSPQRSFEAHTLFGNAMQRLHPAPASPAWPEGRAMRIGVVSPDLRAHSVAFFALPLYQHRDRERTRIYSYFTNRWDDPMTRRLRDLSDKWTDAGLMSDSKLAEAMRDDRLDVLIELSGHTRGHSLAACQQRPAPLIATYIGYPNTTGLSSVDARIVDSLTDPPGTADSLATERLIRLDPCFLCFSPPEDAPDVSPPPSRGPDAVTFGSFNAVTKVNDPLLALWSRVLAAVPGSRLLLKAGALVDPGLQRELARRMSAAGIDPQRVQMLPPTPGQTEHLAGYAQVDVALDTFPYHGTTTTLEALWMGVPVVTLAGDRHASRVGVSLLTNIGRPELIAASPDDYVSIAAQLAKDPARRAALRDTLRPSLAASPICKGRGFCGRMETALRSLCEQKGRVFKP